MAGIVAAVGLFAAGAVSRPWWPAVLEEWVTKATGPAEAAPHKNDTHGPEQHGPAVAGDANSIRLSEQGRKNVGLTLVPVALRDFQRTIGIPGLVVERTGRSLIKISAPLTGTVTKIYPIVGEAVRPGDPLFDLRLTHEDLVQKQSELLRQLEQLDVVRQEVARLEQVTASGAVAGKTLLERQYEQQMLEARIRAEVQGLSLHGLSPEQIDQIVTSRQLLQQLTVVAPEPAEHTSQVEHEDYLQLAQLAVSQGDQVTAGGALATLSDHCELYIEGRAFEQDADALNRAAAEGAELTAMIDSGGSAKTAVPGLRILYVENEVERESRALRFYVALPNELVRDDRTASGHHFISWRFKPGQRVDVLVPVERWEDRIVLPIEALVPEGAEWYVYQQQGGSFLRRPVHVEHRDQQFAVIESDGSLFPGDQVAARGAYQIHLALKNKAGGGPDPHAGHNH